ncbi:MAG: alanine--tRNA ligase [Parvularculales bacterium]
MTSVKDIRTAFLNYFAGRGHEIIPSSPLVPRDDPSLLFVNAGMVPFKTIFTGGTEPPSPRAVSSQKCVRAGGKHNDLDNVGYTARHHTFFEMLGNFSFGDYFKENAIDLAWTLITGEFGLPEEKLLVTVYSDDDEAFNLWKKRAGLPDDRLLRIATQDNFWSMGKTGPCGPCSEIFYDHGADIPGGPPGSPDGEGDRFVEIWNLVFMQYEQKSETERITLPRPSIDTGMGLERIAAVLQGVHDNYDIDLMQALIGASSDLSGITSKGKHTVSHRVIADHLRAVGFLIADGVSPGNEGRGYVLRRIMRRAMRHAHILMPEDIFMWRLTPSLVSQMGETYPELVRAEPVIRDTLEQEETRFRETLARGLRLLDAAVDDLASGAALPGEVAFTLYDTYGFPLDLTQDVLRERDIAVDIVGFDKAMECQREAGRSHWVGSGDSAGAPVWLELAQEHGATEFLGYGTERATGVVQAIVQEGESITQVDSGAEVLVVMERTPFYAESGGQIGDRGVISGPAGEGSLIFEVCDTQKMVGTVIAHGGIVRQGTLRVGDELAMEVSNDWRRPTRANHSATHLLNAALRRVLGVHVAQKGSFVGPDRLRFDFSHGKPVTAMEIKEIEEQINKQIRQNGMVGTRVMPLEKAVEAGAVSLLGEKYDNDVRVLSMGEEQTGEESQIYSMELCGGTHVKRLGDIGLFCIVGESSVSAGVRRIEALTGEAARLHLTRYKDAQQEVAQLLKITPEGTFDRVRSLLEERRQLERELAEARRTLVTGGGEGEALAVRDVEGVSVIARQFQGINPKELRGMMDDMRQKLGSGVVALVSVHKGKAALVVGVTEDKIGSLSAVDLVKAGAEALGGKGGGGRPDMAQAGGPDGTRSEEALESIIGIIRSREDAK